MRINIHYIPAHDNYTTNAKGSNKITTEKVKSSFLFKGNKHKCDVTVMIGYHTGEMNGPLLLCTFHNLSPTLSKKKYVNMLIKFDFNNLCLSIYYLAMSLVLSYLNNITDK